MLFAIRCTLYTVLNMQNKANFKDTKNNISAYDTMGYGIFCGFCRRKNKANQSQFKANQTLFLPKYWLCFSLKLALKLMPREGLIWIVDQLRNLCNNACFSIICAGIESRI